MRGGVIVAGTDTGIGKTVAAAALALHLDADYWKPIQAGLDGETDRETVMRLAGLDDRRAHNETYRLRTPASPHRAAELDSIDIDATSIVVPSTERPLVIELAGGLLVPITRTLLQIDMIAPWRLPVILVASTRLGTINHTLLSAEALRARGIAIAGILFVGEENADTQQIIPSLARVAMLGRLPHLDPLDARNLDDASRAHLDLAPLLDLWEQAI